MRKLLLVVVLLLNVFVVGVVWFNFVIGMIFEFLGLDFMVNVFLVIVEIVQYNVFEMFIKINVDGKVMLLLVSSWELFLDLKIWIFYLCQDVKFQNGEFFNVVVVKFLFE